MSELDWVSLLGECMRLLDECKRYVLETTAKLNDWVKFTNFFFQCRLIFEDHLHGIVPCVFSKNWYFEVGEACLCGYLCVASLLPLWWVDVTNGDIQNFPIDRRCHNVLHPFKNSPKIELLFYYNCVLYYICTNGCGMHQVDTGYRWFGHEYSVQFWQQ